MTVKLENVANVILSSGYEIYVNWVDNDLLNIVGPDNKVISISRGNLIKVEENGLNQRLAAIFSSMNPGYTFSKTTI